MEKAHNIVAHPYSIPIHFYQWFPLPNVSDITCAKYKTLRPICLQLYTNNCKVIDGACLQGQMEQLLYSTEIKGAQETPQSLVAPTDIFVLFI
jgi:hypothetical protein